MKIDENGRFVKVDSGLNWIYIGADVNNKNWSKVGKTTKKLSTRSTGTQNPGYVLFCGFQIKRDFSVHDIEEYLKEELAKYYETVDHYSTGELSEFFVCNPLEMRDAVMGMILNRFPSSVEYDDEINIHMPNGCEVPVYYSCDIELENYFRGWSKAPPSSASANSRNFITRSNAQPEFQDGSSDDCVEFDANHPDFINDYKIQSIYLND